MDEMIESIQHRLGLLNLSAENFMGIGMGSPGVVDRENGTVIGAYNLNWKTLQPVKEKIEKATGIPFFIDNDANVAALGERWMGAGDNQPDVVFMTLGTGVGGGIVAEGKLLHGLAGAAGELGHITVDFDQPIQCTCGKKGCLETVASATGIVNLTRRYADEYAGNAELKKLIDNGEDVNAKIVFDLAKEGDELALIVYRNFARYLGIACANIGRDKEISRIIQILSRKTKNNPVLVGDAGVGKTALALGLAQRIASGDVPAEMAKMRVLELDLMNVVAGTRFRGDFEGA